MLSSSYTLDSIPGAPSSLWIGVGTFVLAGLLLVPLELLAIAAGVCFGVLRGGLVAIIGSLAAAIIGYAAGRAIGAAGLTHWISPRSYRSIRQLSARGVIGVALLRFASVASAGAIHLVCGAGRAPFATYMAGTVIGLSPAMFVLAAWAGCCGTRCLNPSVSTGLTTIGAAVLLFASAAGLRAFLLLRQFAPAISLQRDRSEFG